MEKEAIDTSSSSVKKASRKRAKAKEQNDIEIKENPSNVKDNVLLDYLKSQVENERNVYNGYCGTGLLYVSIILAGLFAIIMQYPYDTVIKKVFGCDGRAVMFTMWALGGISVISFILLIVSIFLMFGAIKSMKFKSVLKTDKLNEWRENIDSEKDYYDCINMCIDVYIKEYDDYRSNNTKRLRRFNSSLILGFVGATLLIISVVAIRIVCRV